MLAWSTGPRATCQHAKSVAMYQRAKGEPICQLRLANDVPIFQLPALIRTPRLLSFLLCEGN